MEAIVMSQTLNCGIIEWIWQEKDVGYKGEGFCLYNTLVISNDGKENIEKREPGSLMSIDKTENL